MYYPEEVVEEVRQRSDIVDVIGSYVRLQKKGANYMGLCPFHNEKSPSFAVHPGKQMYHCFGCGVGGNVFTFVMEYENFTFVEALKYLADRAGVKLPEMEYSEEAKRAADFKSRLYEVNKVAAKFFFYQLKSEQGRIAYDYFKKRALSEETIVKFGLGYSSRYSDTLYKYLKQQGYEDSFLKETGLVTFDEKRGGYDKFWNRAMFPIMDANNKVIAFGGRVLGDGTPKYLNSPETKIFDKSRNLYGLNYAKLSRKPYMLICEGYMDVIALHQAGFSNAVASLGTAFTGLQASLLSRYTKEVLLTYDSDGAGIKAALRAIPILKEAGISVKVVNMKPYKDPDEFIKALGAEEYQKRIDEATGSFFFELGVLEQGYSFDDPEQKTKFFHEVAKKLLEFSDDIERANYEEAVARKYNISYDMLHKLVIRYGSQMIVVGGTVVPAANIQREAAGAQGEQRQKVKKEAEDGYTQSQKLLLTWLSSEPELFHRVKGIITPEDFSEGFFKSIARMVFEQYEQEGTVSPARIINYFEDKEEQTKAAGLFQTSFREEMDAAGQKKAFEDTVRRVKQSAIEQETRKAVESGDMERFQALIAEKNRYKNSFRIPE
ncbi:MAG: DNA primase [Lachnospiraceae bacterium]